MSFHDVFRNSTVTNLTYATSAGTAVSTAGFGAQTRYVSLTAPGAFTTTGGVRYFIDKGAVFNWTQAVKVTPGEQLSTVSNDGIGGTLVVVELTH
jgi:hypothetical protein